MKSLIARHLPSRLRRVHPNHRRIAWGLISVAFFVFSAKLVAAGKEMAVAWRYGVTGEVDAFLLAFTVTTWLPGLLAFVLTLVIVPRLVALRPTPDAHDQFTAELNGTSMFVGASLALLVVALGPAVVGWMAKGLPEETVNLAKNMCLNLVPLTFLSVASVCLAVRLQALEKFSYTALEAMPALGILLFVVSAPPGAGANPLVWGVIAGAIVQVFLLVFLLKKYSGRFGGLKFRRQSGEWVTVYSSLKIMALAHIIMGLLVPIDQFFAARIGDGAVASLGYANRIIALPIGLGATAILRSLLPVISGAAAAGQFRLGRSQVIKWSWLMLGVGAAATLAGLLLSHWGVTLLFERGAFTDKDTEVVTRVLQFGLLQLPFYFAGVVLIQWLAIRKRFTELAMIAAVAVSAKVLFNYLLVDRFSVAGIALATSMSYLVSWAAYETLVYRRKESA